MMNRMFPVAWLFTVLAISAWAQEQGNPPQRPKVLPAQAGDKDQTGSDAGQRDGERSSRSDILSKLELRKALDVYLDGRWLPKAEADTATEDILERLGAAHCTVEEVEKLIRAGRAGFPASETEAGKLDFKPGGLQCEHVDYQTSFYLFVPKSYHPGKPAPLLIVGHGGNGAMAADYAKKAARIGVTPWLPVVERHGMILVAPLSERGWGAVGYSIVFSMLSWTKERYNVDPDRVYLTGHSMGGHLSWRSSFQFPDRWAATSPMSGGYDYVKDRQAYPLLNVPGYATFGKNEPYSINTFDWTIGRWMVEHKYDWHVVEKPGGHEIFSDELPKIAEFFEGHPRDLYRDRIYATCDAKGVMNVAEKNEKWPQPHTWNVDRPIQRGMYHWLRFHPLPAGTPTDQQAQRVWAEYTGSNHFKITSQYARGFRIYLHPKMVDFSKPILVTANDQDVFNAKVAPQARTMLELVREYDDRGRIFHAAIDFDVSGDVEPPVPVGKSTTVLTAAPEATETSAKGSPAN